MTYGQNTLTGIIIYITIIEILRLSNWTAHVYVHCLANYSVFGALGGRWRSQRPSGRRTWVVSSHGAARRRRPRNRSGRRWTSHRRRVRMRLHLALRPKDVVQVGPVDPVVRCKEDLAGSRGVVHAPEHVFLCMRVSSGPNQRGIDTHGKKYQG